MYIIKKENTAITNGRSKSIDYIINNYNKDAKILDYGSGKLRNSNFLRNNQFNNIYVLDIEEQVKKWKDIKGFKGVYVDKITNDEIFEVVLCNFVLNVIPLESERKEIICDINKHLSQTGIAIFEVRTSRDIERSKNKKPFKDGYLMGKNKVKTFQKGYTLEELRNLLSIYFEIIDVKDNCTSIYCIVQKMSH